MKTLLYYEIKMLLRDSRTLFFSVILPILVMPILISGVQKLQEHKVKEEKHATYHMVIGGPYAQATIQALQALGPPGSDKMPFTILPLDGPALSRIREGLADIVIETSQGGTNPPHTEDAGASKEGPQAQVFRQQQSGVPLLKIEFVADQESSLGALARCRDLLQKLQVRHRDEVMTNVGIDAAAFLPHSLTDVASSQKKTQSWRAPALPLVFLFLFLGGASVAAMDSISGERERGSLETLLLTSLPRSHVIAGKMVSVLLVSLGIATIQLTNLIVFVGMGWVQLPEGFRFSLTAPTFLALALVAMTMAVLVAAILLCVSTASTSFKEAQLLYFPVFILCTALAAAAVFPDLRLRSAICVVPLAGLAVAIRDVTLEQLDWLFLLLVVGVNLLASLTLLTAASYRLLPSGELGAQKLDSPLEQKRRNLRDEVIWVYALALAAMLIVPGNFPALGTLLGQVFFNQGIMLTISLGLLLRHRVPLREGLSLRRPPALVWPCALALIPIVQLCANSVVLLTQELLPIPEQMARKMLEVVPENEPLWKLVLLVALAPGICEELAFRGTFLWAHKPVSRRFRPRLACSLVVGLAFGMAHESIYHFLYTALIGVFLAYVCLASDSILPGMLIHLGNNAMAVFAQRHHVQLETLPAWVFALCWVCALVLLRLIHFSQRRERALAPGS